MIEKRNLARIRYFVSGNTTRWQHDSERDPIAFRFSIQQITLDIGGMVLAS